MAKYFILTLSLALVIFAACNKKATSSVAGPSDWLRANKWKISTGTLSVKKPNGVDTVLNYLNWIPFCHRSDYLDFNSPTTGAFFNGSLACLPGDPDSISFTWALSDNNKYLSLYCSDHLYYSVTESILPYVFDTLQWTPYLILDTLYGVNDTAAGYTRTVIVLDTIWNLNFDSTAVANTEIVNAPITNFSANSFTIYYTLLAQYPDSTNMHTGSPDSNPIIRQDTFKYNITYTTR